MTSDIKSARVVLRAVALSYLSIPPVLYAADMSIDLPSAVHLASICLAIVPFIAYALWRRMAVVPDALICLGLVISLAVPVLVWTYAAARMGRPLADDSLAAMDVALGFDWVAFVKFVDARPLLARWLGEAYGAFYLQLLALPPLLVLIGKASRAYAMIFSYLQICVVSSLVSIWFPALGTYLVYGVGLDDLHNINAMYGFFFLEQFNAVRAAGPFTLILPESAGIVTFPSVHAAVAVLCAWAAWDIRLVRYPMLILNIAMAISAISHANHYLVDIIAGAAIAGACIVVTARALFSSPPGLVAALVRRKQPAAAA